MQLPERERRAVLVALRMSRCALRAATSELLSGTLASRPLFVWPTTPRVLERRVMTSLLWKSMSPHWSASCSPARAGVQREHEQQSLFGRARCSQQLRTLL